MLLIKARNPLESPGLEARRLPVISDTQSLVGPEACWVIVLVVAVDGPAAHAEINGVRDEVNMTVTEEEVRSASVSAAEPFDALVVAVVGMIERSEDGAERVIMTLRATARRIAVTSPGSLGTTSISFAHYERVAGAVLDALDRDSDACSVDHPIIRSVRHVARTANCDVVRFCDAEVVVQAVGPPVKMPTTPTIETSTIH